MSQTELGKRFHIDTIIPPVADNTHYVDAGAITIGVEYRVVDEAIVMANLNSHGMDRPPHGARQQIDEDGGVSLHVCDAATRTEYLRFDMFAASPHYHYLCNNEYQINIPYDSNACGDMTEWAFGCLRNRLPDMLSYCGATELAAQLDPVQIEAAMSQVIDLVGRSAQAG
ncbi:MAG: hypothetical protein J2P16_11265 [Mycobacterium sp.]|nr:hypothetical protein [Mycobacterium sp.]